MNLTNRTDLPEHAELQYVNIVFRSILTLCICFGNIMVIAAIQRSPALKNVPNHFIMHLAIADLSVGVTMPFYIASTAQPALVTNIYLCILRYCGIGVTAMASVLCLLSIAVDRYTAIVYPLRYNAIMTLSRARRLTVVIWVMSFVLYLVIPCLWHNEWTDIPDRDCLYVKVMKREYLGGVNNPMFVLATVFIMCLYGRIFYIAHKRGKEDPIGQFVPRNSLEVDLKIAKMAAIVLGIFVLCWFPFVAMVGIQVYGDLVYSEQMNEANSYVTNLLFVNSAVNPVVYAFRSETFMTEFRKLLHIKAKPQSNVQAPAPVIFSTMNTTDTAL
ncbi:adenosine receptor A2b [Lingula anatina]|uniref:Adenosine receptor A2b n=1 Tax=Lingula anatina TaxID=7574 RepID=A0A1S3JUE9_LINAN|nr:adenosine receptor A2b [Lingula anatina]|eukprot:XP_013413721.2 adenosine receptor A2b [Lingula anatina]